MKDFVEGLKLSAAITDIGFVNGIIPVYLKPTIAITLSLKDLKVMTYMIRIKMVRSIV